MPALDCEGKSLSIGDEVLWIGNDFATNILPDRIIGKIYTIKDILYDAPSVLGLTPGDFLIFNCHPYVIESFTKISPLLQGLVEGIRSTLFKKLDYTKSLEFKDGETIFIQLPLEIKMEIK